MNMKDNVEKVSELIEFFDAKKMTGREAIEAMMVAIVTIIKGTTGNDEARADALMALICGHLEDMKDAAKHVPFEGVSRETKRPTPQ